MSSEHTMDGTTMLACVVHGKHDLRVEEVPRPRPGPGEVAIAVELGGICGSDLHYYHRGAVGDFAVREPMILGHEMTGRVAALGAGVAGPPIGTPVTVHPSRKFPDGDHYLGSAAFLPHVQGAFGELLVMPVTNLRVLPDGLAPERAVLTEPLSVALHAVNRAGDVTAARVLVTGAGPIGALVVAVLRHRGAAEVLASDLTDHSLAVARTAGATTTLRADHPDEWADLAPVDVVVECSGAPAGLHTALTSTRRGGRVVQLGLLPPGEVPFAGNLVVTRELTLAGAFRFGDEIDEAIGLLAAGLAVDGIVTAAIPLARAHDAFDLAKDRERASKVLLDLR
jgi:L-idonate 5-dehydrogenase